MFLHQWDIAIRHSAINPSGADLVIVPSSYYSGLELYQNKLIAHFQLEILFLIWIIRKRYHYDSTLCKSPILMALEAFRLSHFI